MAGTEELYIGRRLASRILPPTSVRELLGDAWDGVLPEPDSRAELKLAKRASEALAARIGPVVEQLYPGTIDPPSHPRAADANDPLHAARAAEVTRLFRLVPAA